MRKKAWDLMKKAAPSLLFVLLLALFLCACGKPAPAVTPEPTPEPTPSPIPAPVEVTVTDESAQEILALADIPSLKKIDASQSREYDALLELYRARPDCEILWHYEFEGRFYPNTTRELKAAGTEGLEEAIRYLPALTYVDLIDTDATVEDLDAYSAINPEIDFYWSFIFDGFVIRTDIQCYSSLRDLDYHRFTDEELYPMLKYCRHLKALDLGHDDVREPSVELIGRLTDLQVLILADNPNLVDASPLANLTNLVYLEFFMNHAVEDFSFLNSMTKLIDLNLCYCDYLTELDFLDNMPDMRFGMFKYSGVSQETLDYWKERKPDAYLTIYDGSIHSCEGGWRDTQRNYNIRYAFTCWQYVHDYPDYDHVVFDFNSFNYPQYY